MIFNHHLQYFLFLGLMILFSNCSNSEKNQSRVEHLPFYNEATFTPVWLNPTDEKLNNFHQISSFRLINQEGDTITNKTFEDKIYVVDFFFTICPGICPQMTANMGILQDDI